MNKQPHAFRPVRNMYLAIARIISNESYVYMTEEEFIGAVMKASGGSSNPRAIRNIYFELRKDSGV